MAAPRVQDYQLRASALVEEFSTPDGFDVEACAEAALGCTPSLEQVAAPEQGMGPGGLSREWGQVA